MSTTEQNEAFFESPIVELVKSHTPELDGFKFDFTRYTIKKTHLRAKKKRFKQKVTQRVPLSVSVNQANSDQKQLGPDSTVSHSSQLEIAMERMLEIPG